MSEEQPVPTLVRNAKDPLGKFNIWQSRTIALEPRNPPRCEAPHPTEGDVKHDG